MTASIQFSTRPSWQQDCLALPVEIDGQSLKALMTPEALKRRFGAKSDSRSDLERAIVFHSDVKAIEAMVRSRIESGRVADGEVRFDKDDVMAVSFGEKILQNGSLEQMVREATRQLEEAIGPAAPRASVFWDLSGDGRAVTLRIIDAPDSVDARFDLRQLGKNPIDDDLRFLSLWGDLLQKKSHRQLQRLLAW